MKHRHGKISGGAVFLICFYPLVFAYLLLFSFRFFSRRISLLSFGLIGVRLSLSAPL